MAINYIGGVKTSGNGTSLSLPGYSPAGNDLLVLVVGVFAEAHGLDTNQLSMPVVTDTAGNAWETIGSTPCSEGVYGSGFESGWQLFAFYVRKSKTQTAVVNVAVPVDACNIGMIMQEYSGLDNNFTLDQFQVNSGETGTLITSINTGSFNNTNAFELIFSAAFDNGNGHGNAQTFTPDGSYTDRQSLSDAVNSVNIATFDKTVSVNGTQSNTVMSSSPSDGLHAIVIGFTATPLPIPIVQCGYSFGNPDGPNEAKAIIPFAKPNTLNNSIIVAVFGTSNVPIDIAGNAYHLLVTSGGIKFYFVASCLGGRNIITVNNISGIGGVQSCVIAFETYPAAYISSSAGNANPGVEAIAGPVTANSGDLLLALCSQQSAGITATQQFVGEPDYSLIAESSGLGFIAGAPWAGCALYHVGTGTANYGFGVGVAEAVDLTAVLIGFTITYPPPVTTPLHSLLIWDNSYLRFRNQSYSVQTMFYEADTNLLLFVTPEETGYAIRYLAYQDYEDEGWSAGVLQRAAIPVTIQLPYQDLGKPHFPKQWNTVEMDVDTQGQDLTVILNFDDGISPINIGTVNTVSRQKVQLQVNDGDGQQSYKCSPELLISVLNAPIIYQMNVYAAVLAANRSSLDTYWIKFDSDEFKLAKEGYFDYTSTAAITVDLYADGRTEPYYTFTLPINSTRLQVPERVRFPAMKFRLWRLVMTSTAAFQMWSAPTIRVKPCLVGPQSYANADLNT